METSSISIAAASGCGTEEGLESIDRTSTEAVVLDLGHPAAVADEYIVTFHQDVGAKAATAIEGYRALGVEVLESYAIIPGFAGRMSLPQLEAPTS